MRRLLFLFSLIFLTQFSTMVLADKGQQKPSEVAEEKRMEPVEVVETEQRVCGWSDSTFVHTEQGSNFNYGVSSLGSGVWGPGYSSYPANKTVYGSSYSCSPRKFNQVTTKKEPVNE